MSHPVHVDPAVLRASAADFEGIGSAVESVQLGSSLSGVVGGLGALRTGAVLDAAAERVDGACSTVAAKHHSFADDLGTTADRYETTDTDAGGMIGRSVEGG